MARRKIPKPKSPHAQLGHKSQGLGSAALADARRRLAQLEAERQARGKMSAREIAAATKKAAKARDAEYRAKARTLAELGLYNPKVDEAGLPLALTPWRKRQINAGWREAEALATGAVFAEMPGKASKTQRAEIRREVERAGGRITKTGIFLPRAEREMRQPKGRLTFDKQLGLWTVKVRKKVGRGSDTRTITETRPLAGADALERLQGRFIKKFDKAPFDPRKERLRFIIHGRNVSKRSFRDLASLFKYANAYRSTARAQATFLDSLTIIRVVKTPEGEWRKPVGALGARGWRELDEDETDGFDDEDLE